MVRQWLPDDPEANDLRRAPTHQMICFQMPDPFPGLNDSGLASWCALYPLGAGPFTEPEHLIRLEVDRSTLLDLDVGASVAAARLEDGRWEIRPLEGDDRMVTATRMSKMKTGFAEARGLPQLIIPRPTRPVSPYVQATFGTTKWVASPSLESVDKWRRRRRKAVVVESVATVGVGGAAVVAAVAGSPQAIMFGAIALFTGVSIVRRRTRDRVVTAADEVEAGGAAPTLEAGGHAEEDRAIGTGETTGVGGQSFEPPVIRPGALRTPVDLDWRPSHDHGVFAWVSIPDDEHGRLEAPVAGLPDHLFDAFPTVATIDGHFGSGQPVLLTLDDGSQLLTIRPLRQATAED